MVEFINHLKIKKIKSS